jgi:hypothetical protein
METISHDIGNLFLQLGLPSGAQDIDQFVGHHKLPHGIALHNAPYWNASQALFLKQAIECDSEWSEVVDQLAVRLN